MSAGTCSKYAAKRRALVQTVDFFPPVVDDPRFYGAIAAANSLSDVYAMGGKPFTALSLAGFPKDFPKDWRAEILRGGYDKIRESGAILCGGHTVESDVQFGYSIIEDSDDVPFNFFYTSNLSLSRRRLLEEPFDTGFPYPAWEDIEASYRLFRRGLRLVFEREAVALHHHPTSLGRFFDRQEKAGYSAVVFYQRHPELGPFLGLAASGPPEAPALLPQRLREWVAQALQFLPVRPAGLWESALRFHYIRGLRRGWQDHLRRVSRTQRVSEGVER